MTNCCQNDQIKLEIVADIERLKLDFLILPKQIKENTRLLSIINAQKQLEDENASCTELLDCKLREL